MTDDSSTVHDSNELETIRKAVTERVKNEEIKYSSTGTGNKKVRSEFVEECMDAQELGMGLLYAEINRGTLVFNNSAQEWLVWDGHHWERDLMELHLAAIEEVVDRLLEEAGEIGKLISQLYANKKKAQAEPLQNYQKRIQKKIEWLRTDRGRIATIKFARTCKIPLAIKGGELDLEPWLLPCKNGVIDLRSGKFRDGRPEEYLFRASPTEWLGFDEPCSRWEEFLMEIHDEKLEVIKYIQRLLGYSITGLNIEHIFPVFYGQNGRNGKGVIVEVLNHLLGPLAGAIQSELLLDQRRARSSAGPSPDIMGLKGLRLAFASETDEGRRFSAAKVKWLTGGDQLVGRYPHDKHEVHFTPTHTLFLLTNRKPNAPGDDLAFWERMHLVPFRISFVNRKTLKSHEREADKYLGQELKKEASGILAWLVRGCLGYQKCGLDPPIQVIEATAEYRRNEDILADWREDYCIVGPDEKGSSTELHDHFSKWFRKFISRKKEISQRRFGDLLGRQFEKTKSGGNVYYFGIDLNPDAPEIEED